MALLADGRPHRKDELWACLDDELADRNGSAIRVHVFNLRQKLRRTGEWIIVETVNNVATYRHVRLLASPYDGRT